MAEPLYVIVKRNANNKSIYYGRRGQEVGSQTHKTDAFIYRKERAESELARLQPSLKGFAVKEY